MALWKDIRQITEAAACFVWRNASQTISDSTITPVGFDSEVFKTHSSMHDNATNNSRVIVPVAGKYLVIGNVMWLDAISTDTLLEIRVNGTTFYGTSLIGTRDGFNHPNWSHMISAVIDLAANDYIELIVEQYTGGNLNLQLNGTSNFMCVAKVF